MLPVGRSRVEAERLRADLAIGSGFADVFEVARLLGAEVYLGPLGDSGVEGAFKRREGVPFILVNADRPQVRQRYTLAHEIGHLRLGGSDGVVESPKAIFDRHNPEERNANIFAAFLLMDEPGVQAVVEGVRDAWDRVARVAATYVVSAEAAAIHLGDLDLIRADEQDEILGRITSQSGQSTLKRYGYVPSKAPRLSPLERLDPRHVDDALAEFTAGTYSREALAGDFGLTADGVDALVRARGVMEPVHSTDVNLDGLDELD